MTDWQFRLRYFGFHFLFSSILATISLCLIFFVWFPSPLADATGVSKIVLLMLGIDIILGPILTLVLAKQGKKGLKFDLVIVLTCQLVALSYGLYSIGISRPAWIVFYVDSFDVLQVTDLQPKVQSKKPILYPNIPWFGYKYYYIPKPKNDAEHNERLSYNLKTGFGPTQRPDMYQPIDHGWEEITLKQQSMQSLKKIHPEISLEQPPYSDATGWFPLRAYINPKVVLVNTNTKSITKIINLSPQ